MKKMLKRYLVFIILVLINIAVIVFFPQTGLRSLEITGSNALEMLSVIPPIFLLLGLLDVWVQKETMIKIMGEKSKFVGIAIAYLLGTAAAGPLYAAFPVAGMLMKKGSKFSNVLIFIGAWSTTKIPLLLFETSSLGWKFTLLRLLLDLPVIAVIAFITKKTLNKKQIEDIYQRAKEIE